jgi:hypothetical protein
VDYLNAGEVPNQSPYTITHPKGGFGKPMSFLVKIIKYVHCLQYFLSAGLKCFSKSSALSSKQLERHLVHEPLACPVWVLVGRLSIKQKSIPYLCKVAAAMNPAGPAPTMRTSVLWDLKAPTWYDLMVMMKTEG